MKYYRKILIKYNVLLKKIYFTAMKILKVVFHIRENIIRGYFLFRGEYQIYIIECSEKISIFHECITRVTARVEIYLLIDEKK